MEKLGGYHFPQGIKLSISSDGTSIILAPDVVQCERQNIAHVVCLQN